MCEVMTKCLAIIPARGGSKRIPYKNVKFFCGQPIIKYSIDAALQSRCFDTVMVSTDARDIANVALENGAQVPFFRSEKNSNDYAMLSDVIEEVLLEYKKIGKEFNFFCCILATAPFISSIKILNTFELLRKSGADSVVPVVRFGYPIQRGLKIENGTLKMIWPENMHVRSQDLMPAYHDVGQFYWMRVGSFLEQKKIFAENTVAFEIPETEVQDIDTVQDWEIAEMKYQLLKKQVNVKNKNYEPYL
jgi:pseudaminic acid cytidylyltransferase